MNLKRNQNLRRKELLQGSDNKEEQKGDETHYGWRRDGTCLKGEGGRVEPTKPTRASSHGRGAAAAVDSGAAVSHQEER